VKWSIRVGLGFIYSTAALNTCVHALWVLPVVLQNHWMSATSKIRHKTEGSICLYFAEKKSTRARNYIMFQIWVRVLKKKPNTLLKLPYLYFQKSYRSRVFPPERAM